MFRSRLGVLYSANAIEKSLGVAKLLLAGRLLGPTEFGLYGLSLVVIMTMDLLSQVGVEAALIRKEHLTRQDKDTAWLLLFARGLLLGAAAWFGSSFVGQFFGNVAVVPLVRLLAIGFLMNSIQSVEYYLARRELRFGPWFWVRVSGSLVDLGVSLALAWSLHTAWALVVGYVVAGTVRTAVGYVAAPYTPHFSLSSESLRYLLQFGRWAGGLSIVLYLLTQGDDLVVGKVLGAGALGLYQLAYRVSNMPTSEVTHVLSNFTLPLYAQLSRTGHKSADAFKSVVAVTALVSLPAATAIALMAKPFVAAFLGQQWQAAVPLMQWLAIWGVTRSLDASAGALFFALGRPDLDFKLHMWKLVLLASLIVPAVHRWGLGGVAGTVVLCGLVVSPVTSVAAFRLVQLPARSALEALRAPIAAALVTAVLLGALRMLGLGSVLTLGMATLVMAALVGIVVRMVGSGQIAEARVFVSALRDAA